MMKKNIALLFIVVPVLLAMLPSCRKQADAPFEKNRLSAKAGDGVPGTPLPGQTTYCRIESLWLNPNTPGQKFILVLYDQYENPTAVTQPNVGTGHPYRTFKYDQWHRLRQYRGEYSNGSFEFWHFYGYDQNGRIGVDTMYALGSMSTGAPTNYFERTISKIHYDAQGRIIKIMSHAQIGGYHYENNYTYDANGNLVYPPGFGIVYDNKENINRTNDIWQFLNRDYSKNNPYTASAYTPSGFPTVINVSRAPLFLNEFNLAHSQIGYGCRPAFW